MEKVENKPKANQKCRAADMQRKLQEDCTLGKKTAEAAVVRDL